MSLKTFHLVFVIAATLLSAFLAVWCFQRYMIVDSVGLLAGGIGATIAGLFLIWYAIRFIQKFRNVRYY